MKGWVCLLAVSTGCVLDAREDVASRRDAIWSGEFEAGVAESPVEIEAFAVALDVWDTHVTGCVETTFAAESGEDMSGSHRFALPRGAVIHRAEVLVGDAWQRAETLGRREGQEVFEDVIEPEAPRDPLLLQQIGVSGYRARVFPIGEGRPLSARFCYSHPLELDASGERLRLGFAEPTDAAPRTAGTFDVEVTLHDPRWSDAAWIANVGDAETSPGHASFHAGAFPLGEPVELLLLGDAPPRPLVALAYDSTAESIEDHLFVRWLPDFSAYPAVRGSARTVVFVVDTSGSMAGAKIDEARTALSEALDALSAEDRWGLVSFSEDVHAFRPELSGEADLEGGLDFVAALVAGGSTNLAGGLVEGARVGATSTENRPIDLFVLSDGLPTVGSGTSAAILDEVRSAAGARSVRIFAVGIGADLDQSLLNALAHETDGEATFALDDSEICGQVLDLLARVRGGGVGDVEIGISGGGVGAAETFRWRRLFPDTPIALSATGATVDGPVDVTLHGVTTDGEPVDLAARVTPSRGDDECFLPVPPLAAQAWADRLNRTIDETLETDELVGDAVVVAKRYGILGRYSSLLALEDESMFDEYGIERIDREAAGIALEDVVASTEDETRIGGAGVDDPSAGPGGDADADADADWAPAEGASGDAAGCSCRTGAHGGPSAFGLLALLVMRRRRRS